MPYEVVLKTEFQEFDACVMSYYSVNVVLYEFVFVLMIRYSWRQNMHTFIFISEVVFHNHISFGGNIRLKQRLLSDSAFLCR